MSLGKIRIPKQRTSSGKRIECWKYSLLDGRHIDIPVTLHATADGLHFVAAANSPLIGKMSWKDTDLDRLAHTVERGIAERVDTALSGDWHPGHTIRAVIDSKIREGREVAIRIESVPVRFDARSGRGNDRTYRVSLPNTTIARFRETSAAETAETAIVSGIRIDTPHAQRLLPQAQVDPADIDRLFATLEAFGRELQHTLGPDYPYAPAIPRPADLVEMMRRAAASAGAPEP